jgi:hypothetical protein
MYLDCVELALGPKAVIEWIMNYFCPPPEKNQAINAFDALKGANPVASSDRMPLILQVRYPSAFSSMDHKGWSRSILVILVL